MKFNCGEPNNSHDTGEHVAEFYYSDGRVQINDRRQTDVLPFVCSKDDDCKEIDSILDSCSSNYGNIINSLASKSSAQSVTDLESEVLQMQTELASKASAQSVTDLDTKLTNLVNDLNSVSTDNATPSLFGIDKDSLIVGLLLINVLVMFTSILICYSSQKPKRYTPIKAVYSSEEEQENIRLK